MPASRVTSMTSLVESRSNGPTMPARKTPPGADGPPPAKKEEKRGRGTTKRQQLGDRLIDFIICSSGIRNGGCRTWRRAQGIRHGALPRLKAAAAGGRRARHARRQQLAGEAGSERGWAKSARALLAGARGGALTAAAARRWRATTASSG